MKKISKKDLQGLRKLFPVLEKEEMRRYVGGNSGGYYGDDWLNHGFGSYDPDGNFHWYGGYTQDEFDNWEGPWYGGWVYGMGYVFPDVNVGYKPDGEYGNPDLGYNGYCGYGSSGGDEGDSDFRKVDNGRCSMGAIVNAGIKLGLDLTESSVTSDLENYWDRDINRYRISDNQMEGVLDDYFNVIMTDRVAEITRHVVLGKPIYVRLVTQEDDIGGVIFQQLHDVVIIGVNNSANGYFEYYDTVEGTVGRLTSNELEEKSTRKYYVLDYK